LNLSFIDQFFTRSEPQPLWSQIQRREEKKQEAIKQPQVQERGAMQQVQKGQLNVDEKQVQFLCKFHRLLF